MPQRALRAGEGGQGQQEDSIEEGEPMNQALAGSPIRQLSAWRAWPGDQEDRSGGLPAALAIAALNGPPVPSW